MQHGTQGVDWEQLLRLFKRASLGGREGDKVRRAFEKSTIVCFAFLGSQLVGAARALSDNEYHASIYDVVVHPDHQCQGLGTQLLRDILERLPVWRVLLVADESVQSFYQRLGFQPYDGVMARMDRTKLYDEPDR